MGTLLSPVLTKRLANFKITTNRIVRGGQKGERRSQRLGSSLEFSDYRLYSPGDDLRQIDWNTYARLQKFYIKRFLDEQELSVSVYLDCTKSMGVDQTKWYRAKQLAAVFSFLSLANSDRLSIIPVAQQVGMLPHTKGKAMTNKVIGLIESIPVTDDNLQFGQSLQTAVNQSNRSGLSILISDFLDDPSDLFQAIKKMQAKQQQVLLIQVLLPEEQSPDYVGDLKLVDVETGGEKEVSMNSKVVGHYKQLFEAHTLKIQSFCNGRGIDFIPCPTSVSLEETIFSNLSGKGWIGR